MSIYQTVVLPAFEERR